MNEAYIEYQIADELEHQEKIECLESEVEELEIKLKQKLTELKNLKK